MGTVMEQSRDAALSAGQGEFKARRPAAQGSSDPTGGRMTRTRLNRQRVMILCAALAIALVQSTTLSRATGSVQFNDAGDNWHSAFAAQALKAYGRDLRLFDFGRNDVRRAGPPGRSEGLIPCSNAAKCEISVSIVGVEYHLKGQGFDEVKVSWNLDAPCFRTASEGAAQYTDNIEVSVEVSVKRKYGRVDSGSKIFRVSSPGPYDTFVNVPRGPLETDPVSYTVSVTPVAVTAARSVTAHAFGNGVPSLTSGPQSSPNIQGPSASCFPQAVIDELQYVQGSVPGKDTVLVGCSLQPPLLGSTQNPCFPAGNLTGLLTVKLKRANGSTDTATFALLYGHARVNLFIPGGPGNVASFDVVATAKALYKGTLVSASKSGTF